MDCHTKLAQDATNTTFVQILEILRDDGDTGKRLISNEGLRYCRLLAARCARVLASIEPAIDEACLDGDDRKASKKQKTRAVIENFVSLIDPLKLKLDEDDFLERLEKTKWTLAMVDIEECMEELYELQLHTLLLLQVLSVNALSSSL
jgi:hypothetical protein